MVNRWQGNTGKYVRIEEPFQKKDAPQRSAKAPQSRSSVTEKSRRMTPSQSFPPLQRVLSGLLPAELPDFETDDIILLLILYLMYRESGDSELLIIMGAMFLL